MRKLVCLLLALVLMTSAVAFAEGTKLTYDSRDVKVPAIVTMPELKDGEKCPLVVMSHGHGGSKDENIGFGAIADALAAKGIASVRMDFPGCGESAESFQLNCMSNMKQDVQNALTYTLANYPIDENQIGLFGYSMGGRITLELLADMAIPNVKAVALLAPGVSDMKVSFGSGESSWEDLKAEAAEKGFVTHTTAYGQVQELSKQWFEDLESRENQAEDAAKAFEGPVLVMYADDDPVVTADVSKGVAAAFGDNATLIDATGDSHSYGFYSEKTDVLNTVVNGTADFFGVQLTSAE